jgi:hypothetical protein
MSAVRTADRRLTGDGLWYAQCKEVPMGTGQGPSTEIDTAAAQAERLAEAIRSQNGSLDPVFHALDGAITAFDDAGYEPEDLLPANAEPGTAFSLRERRNGQTLWEAIVQAARDTICSKSADIKKLITPGGHAASAGLVSLIVTSLGLPIIAIPIAVAIASVILSIGLKGFCEWSGAPADGPSSA